jgi:hypothetical protein
MNGGTIMSKQKKPKKATVRQLTVQEAMKWLSDSRSKAGVEYKRVIAAIRDPLDEHKFISIAITEMA